MSDETVLPVVDAINESAPQSEAVLSDNISGLKIDSPHESANGKEDELVQPAESNDEVKCEPSLEEPILEEPVTEIKSSGHDANLIDIINSMEEDRKKFIAHVHNKIASQDSEFEVTNYIICIKNTNRNLCE